jgi:tungstate transport system substrate-binding protein
METDRQVPPETAAPPIMERRANLSRSAMFPRPPPADRSPPGGTEKGNDSGQYKKGETVFLKLSNKSKIVSTLAILVILAGLIAGMAACTSTPTPTPTPSPTSSQITPTTAPTTTAYPVANPKTRFKIATTTSLYDTGLWAYLEPQFEAKYKDYKVDTGIPYIGVELDIIYAGTGAAINAGKAGNVDAVIVHDPDQEKTFVSDNWGINKRAFAYNFFMIAGPSSDPAAIKDINPADAFKKIAAAGKADPTKVKFVSRGDNSGTHGAEKRLWAAAGFNYTTDIQKQPWYVEAGQGMGPTLTMANEMNAYVLCDGSTFTSYKGKLTLAPLVTKTAAETLNVYDAYSINPDKIKTANIAMSKLFINWLISSDVQKVIGQYGVKEFGGPLFFPIQDPTYSAIPNLAQNMQPIP